MHRHGEGLAFPRGPMIGVLASVVLAVISAAGAQEQEMRLEGRVQWIAGEKMMLIPDSGAPPVEVDIKQVPLDDYRTLTEGDSVVVSGVVSPDGRKLIARSVSPAAR